MNKQQLANKIWQAANRMRSKIEANEYKDYILGFIFYKYLSDSQVLFLRRMDWTEADMQADLNEGNAETLRFVQDNMGYFIAYDDLFSTWLAKGLDFDVSNVRDALSAFARNVSTTHTKVFSGIFDTLAGGLSKLGESSGAQTKAISDLLNLIKDIPIDGKQDYDVLGFIYEFLLERFAANAGKKAGEFYTPHEVSLLMSEIVAHHLKDRRTIQIYDPTSGSGSLLINIGKSIAKYTAEKDSIKYYAQELKQNTYNLTRMNLIMRNIHPSNIVSRNGDTLEEDWPYFEDNDPANTYEPLYVDAVVSNPPYSQEWNPKSKENDPRFARFGIAPRGKADYAFLLHDLFHTKPDGIMAIVLPHGVLFRGGEEGEIRKNLIEYNHIDAIIGLPPNIFYGTGIPTIIMILKQKRDNTDVMIIDASKGFAKEGKNNKLRASDIQRIVDVVTERRTVEKYSRAVSREEIRENEYNLNIPRYVDSSEAVESWDMYALMFGGIPKAEINALGQYWEAFPNLKQSLFTDEAGAYVHLAVQDMKKAIAEHTDVREFVSDFRAEFASFPGMLRDSLIGQMNELIIPQYMSEIRHSIFARLSNIPLIDPYEVYQVLADKWVAISADLEMIQTEGFSATKQVDPNMVARVRDGKEVETQEGWVGRIIPFELIAETVLAPEYRALREKEQRLAEIATEYTEMIDELSEEDKESDVLNEDKDRFVPAEVRAERSRILARIESPEINALIEYMDLRRAAEKQDFIAAHPEVSWDEMEANKNGTYSTTEIKRYIAKLQEQYEFPEDSFEYVVLKVQALQEEETTLRREIRAESADLHELTKETIEGLDDAQVLELLEQKWIQPLLDDLNQLPQNVVDNLVADIEALMEKYDETYASINDEIRATERELAAMIDELEGNEYDMKGLSEFKTLLLGE